MRSILFLFAICAFSQFALGQTHTIEIHPNNRVASLLMSPSEYQSWIDNDEFGDFSVRSALVEDIYEKFEDDFDFIFLVLNEDTKPANLSFGTHVSISNDVTGIGKSVFNSSSSYGSAGRLQSLVQLTRLDFLRSGPCLHEIMHKWANFALDAETVSGTGTNLSSFSSGSHWGYTGGSNRGQLGGFDQSTLVDNGGGSYTVEAFGSTANGGNSVPYTGFELYLMGMIPLNQVSEFDMFTDITSLSLSSGLYTFDAGTRTTYDSTALKQLLGPRVPSVTTSQKDFKALIVVLTDTPLTSAQWTQIDEDAEKFSRKASDGSSSYNFWEATNGQGSFDFGNLDQSVKGTTAVSNLLAATDVSYFPNPTSGALRVELGQSYASVYSRVLNIHGQQVQANQLDNTDYLWLNIEGAPGMYFVEVRTGDGYLTTLRVLKE